MANSKVKVLEQFPTARALCAPDGKRWYLDGVHGVFELQAADEAGVWDEALKYIKLWPDAQERYLLRAEYHEQFGKADR